MKIKLLTLFIFFTHSCFSQLDPIVNEMSITDSLYKSHEVTLYEATVDSEFYTYFQKLVINCSDCKSTNHKFNDFMIYFKDTIMYATPMMDSTLKVDVWGFFKVADHIFYCTGDKNTSFLKLNRSFINRAVSIEHDIDMHYYDDLSWAFVTIYIRGQKLIIRGCHEWSKAKWTKKIKSKSK